MRPAFARDAHLTARLHCTRSSLLTVTLALETEVLARDIHPAEILLPDGSILRQCRAFVTSHRLLAFAMTPDRRIELVAELTLTEPKSVPASRNTLQGRLEIVTPEGTAWVNRGRGCGCGSALSALGTPVPWTRRGL